MNQTQLPFLVEAVLIAICSGIGFLLRKSGKPYKKAQLGLHLLFFLWFSTGFGFIVASLPAAHPGTALWLAVAVMGFSLLLQLSTGLGMMFAKQSDPRLPKIHLVAASVLLVADLCGLILAGGNS